MLCDADTHYVPFEVFEVYDPEYLKRLEAYYPKYNVDNRWKQFYEQIKDSGWPEAKSVKDFLSLPNRIKQEIKEEHYTAGLFISQNLDFIYFDPPENEFPRLETIEATGKILLKTDRQVINTQERGYSYNNVFYGTEFMKIYNTVMKKFCQQNTRFDTPMMYSTQDLTASMDYLESNLAEGFFGLRLIDHHPWGYIREFYSVFEFCSKHRIPLYLHLANATEDTPANLTWNYQDPIYLKLLRQYPHPRFHGKGFGWIVAIMSFITSGVLDQLPDLRIVSTEHGLEWIVDLRKWCEQNNLPDPLPYFQKNFWFTCEPEEPNFLSNARMLGWERLLYATDYPHNDPGGNHRYQDLNLLDNLLERKELTFLDYENITHKSYLKLVDRI
jgi:predicted TIM-barrel fold metal-dependent hydrolase